MTDAFSGKKAVFAGCARNCAEFLPHIFANISHLSTLFAQSAFIFVENDSTDSTSQIIQSWCAGRKNALLISLDGFAETCPVRTLRLAAARNGYLTVLRADFSDYDYLFVMDCDEENIGQIDLEAVRRGLQFLDAGNDHAGVFANSQRDYYDMWALRHPKLCPGDIWEEVCDYALTNRVRDDEAFHETFAKRIFSLPMDAPPLEVDSAFGGFGIYKVGSLIRNTRDHVGYKIKNFPAGIPELDGRETKFGWQCCEHISLHAGFREQGEKLFVLPYLVNSWAQKISFAPGSWRYMPFDPRLVAGGA